MMNLTGSAGAFVCAVIRSTEMIRWYLTFSFLVPLITVQKPHELWPRSRSWKIPQKRTSRKTNSSRYSAIIGRNSRRLILAITLYTTMKSLTKCLTVAIPKKWVTSAFDVWSADYFTPSPWPANQPFAFHAPNRTPRIGSISSDDGSFLMSYTAILY